MIEMIATFHSLSNSSATMTRYPNMVLIISLLTFFFSKNIIYISLVLVFITNTLNSIIKFAMCFFPCLNVLIFYLVSATLFLSLNTVLNFLNEIVPILDVVFFFYLVNLLLCIDFYYTLSKLG